ncbi:hypothetical protein [Actinokineospora inagensis]|uniref:hypothetical protein n=1 Tax=Actinokineospora inagensis TaxID=103730 RepID=UPI000401EF5A
MTDVMRKQIIDCIEARWETSLRALKVEERSRLVTWFPHLATLKIEFQHGKNCTNATKTPHDH